MKKGESSMLLSVVFLSIANLGLLAMVLKIRNDVKKESYVSISG